MKRIIIPLFMVVIIVSMMLGTAMAYADDWPQFHHDNNLSGVSSSDAPDTNHVAWTYQTDGSVESSPAVVEGILYVGSQDGNLYALDAVSGSLVWSFDAESEIQSSPAVSGGNVYFLATDGNMYAVDAVTGISLWSTVIGPGPYDWSSPALNGGNVFIASSTGTMYSLDAMTGATVWATPVGGTPDSPIAVANGKVYTGTHNFDTSSPTLVALDEATGAILWTYDYHSYHPGVVGMVNSNGATVADGDGDGDLDVYFGVYNWNGVGPQAVCLDEATGNENWSVSIGGNSTSTPAVHNGQVFIGSDDSNVYALDAITGGVNWNTPTGGQVWAAPAVADGKVFVGSLDHTFYAFDEATGAIVWSYFTGASRLISSPAVADGMVFVGNENGKVYAFADLLFNVDKHWSYTNVCFKQDNDGDGLYDEDGPEIDVDTGELLLIDNDEDGLIDEDPVECEGEYSLGTELTQLEATVKNGAIKNINPGQFYAVSTVEVLEDLDELVITENYSGVISSGIGELNPRKGGGKVVVVKMDGETPVQILDAMDEEVDVDLGNLATITLEDVEAGDIYKVYVKFKPALKGTDWEEATKDAANLNCAHAYAGDGMYNQYACAEVTIEVVEK